MRPILFAAALGALLLPRPAAAAPPSPSEFLGFTVGADRTLADWEQIVRYFRALDAASDRVVTEEVGKTTEGRPFLVVTISSAENIRRREQIRQDVLRLADPRGLSAEEADRLVAGGPTVVALHHGIHSTEVAATQTALETAYWLATAEDAETRAILDGTVVVMLPSHNPDGTQKVTEWYRASLGRPWEGRDIPFLYQKYVGHDNNRDWYMFTQAESRLTTRFVYDRWRPQIVHDLHQMGTTSARLFAPPYVDPWEPNVDPALIAAVNDVGTHVASRLTTEGKTGIVVRAIFDAWTPARAYPHSHGGVRVLTEVASAHMATPLEMKFEDLRAGIGYDPKARTWNQPAPWGGGTWRMRDIMDYQFSATRAILGHASAHRAHWRRTMHEVNRRAAGRSVPFAFVIPSGQRDPLAVRRLLDVLITGAVEVHAAEAAFEAGGRRYPAGSWVVPLAQPFSSFAKAVLERQRYPELRPAPGAPPQRPYDVTAHTLPLLMGVEVAAVDTAFDVPAPRVTEARVVPGRVEPGRARWLALGHSNTDLVAAGRLLDARVPVRWARAAFREGARAFPAGTLLVPASARRRVQTLARELGVMATPVAAAPAAWPLRRPRVGLYQSWVASMDEGWTRYIFERELEIPYTTLNDADVKAGGLSAHFDVIVLPDQPLARTIKGHTGETVPPEYRGGLGDDGVAALRAFVEAGGTLVTLDSASELPLASFDLPVTNALEALKAEEGGEETATTTRDTFASPGALLKVHVDPESPLGHGLPAEAAIWFENSPAFETQNGTVVARYGTEDPLLSGWLLGGSHLHGRAALVDVPKGRGRVVLFGFRPQYRAQSWATYVALTNALYSSVLGRGPTAAPAR